MIACRVFQPGSFSDTEHSAKAIHCCDICWFRVFTDNENFERSL